MSILYKPKKMVCAIPGKEKTGYYATKASGSIISFNDLCTQISDKCSMSSSDVKGVVEALVKEIEFSLYQGYSIHVDDLGIFSTNITSPVVDSPEDLTPKKVKIKSISYLPSKRLKSKMEKATFMRLRDFNQLINDSDEE